MYWCHPDKGWIRVVGPKARPKVRGQIRYFRASGWYARWGSGGINLLGLSHGRLGWNTGGRGERRAGYCPSRASQRPKDPKLRGVCVNGDNLLRGLG